MPKFAYIGVPTNASNVGDTDLGGITFKSAYQTFRAHLYELTISFSVVPANGALRGILRLSARANTNASGTVTPLDDADSPVLASPIRANAYPHGARTILDFAINENATYTWTAMDDDQRIVLCPPIAGDTDVALTAGCRATTTNGGLRAIADFKFENT